MNINIENTKLLKTKKITLKFYFLPENVRLSYPTLKKIDFS